MIRELEGVEDDPDERAMRQVPSSKSVGNMLWISEDGCMRRRFFNPWTKKWEWGDILDYVYNDDCHICGTVDGKKEALDRIIAYAWLKRRSRNVGKVAKRNPQDLTIAHNLFWEDDDFCSSDEDVESDDDTWKRLIWTTNSVACDDRYEISNRLRLRTPSKKILKGNVFKNIGTFCAIKDSGLIHLERAVQNVTIPKLPPRLQLAAHAILSGYTPKEFAQHANILESTAWTYFCKAIDVIDPKDALEWGKQFINNHVWECVLQLDEEKDIVLGKKLSLISDMLSVPVSHMPHLRFVVSCLRRIRCECEAC